MGTNKHMSVLPLGSLTTEEMQQISREMEVDLNPEEWDQSSKLWVLVRTENTGIVPCLLHASTDHPSDLIEEITDELETTVANLRSTLGPFGPTEICGYMLYIEGWSYSPEVQNTMNGASMQDFLEFWQSRPPKSLAGTDMAVEIKQLTCMTGGSSAIGVLTRGRGKGEPKFTADKYPNFGGVIVDSLRHLMHMPSINDLTALSWLIATS